MKFVYTVPTYRVNVLKNIELSSVNNNHSCVNTTIWGKLLKPHLTFYIVYGSATYDVQHHIRLPYDLLYPHDSCRFLFGWVLLLLNACYARKGSIASFPGGGFTDNKTFPGIHRTDIVLYNTNTQ